LLQAQPHSTSLLQPAIESPLAQPLRCINNQITLKDKTSTNKNPDKAQIKIHPNAENPPSSVG